MDIVLSINIVYGVASTSKTPSRMSNPKLLEMEMNMQKFLQKRYICLNMSPRGAPMLLVKKKDGALNQCDVVKDSWHTFMLTRSTSSRTRVRNLNN